MGNALTAQYACSDISSEDDSFRPPLFAFWAPINALLQIFKVFEFNNGYALVLGILSWTLLVLFELVNWYPGQYFGNSWTEPSRVFWISLLFGFLWYYLFMLIFLYLPFRGPACQWLIDYVDASLDPTTGPPIYQAARNLYKTTRRQRIYQGLAVPPQPAGYV